MIFNLVGAEYAAAARVATPYVAASDDPRYAYMLDNPHPENIERGLANRFSMILKATPITYAKPWAGNEFIYTHVDQLITNADSNSFIFALWAPFDRKSIIINNIWHHYELNSDINTVPTPYYTEIEDWMTNFNLESIEKYWHEKIWKLRKKLHAKQIPFLFGMESTTFQTIKRKHRWGDDFIDPYNITLVDVCKEHSNPSQGFFDEYAYAHYVNYAMKYIIPKIK